ncbi:YlbF family regulator [Streptococcus dentiloxodontae]
MEQAEQVFQESLDELLGLLKANETVLAYQAAEADIQKIPFLRDLARQMKAYQQEAVLFQKIEKAQAYEDSDQKAGLIQEELDQMPIVQDYRNKMQDASDLLQYVTKTLEAKINEELRHD